MKKQPSLKYDLERTALWKFRREMGISDDDASGWMVLCLVLVRQFLPEKLNLPSREMMVAVLMGTPDDKTKMGAKIKWTDDKRRHVLAVIDELKAANPAGTDQSIIGRHFQHGFKNINVSEKTLINQVSISRRMVLRGEL